ncbi:glycosyltransferase [Flavobacterium oreochromis]|uniref:glycosyltransferase n=1 Tax=Flavobacterium oreochromis TaxID=2906078 RepID=UPI00385A24DB
MREGNNPHKDLEIKKNDYLFQIVIPVYIPHFEGYFKESFKIFKLSVESVLKTISYKTFITIINNGSCKEVKEYLDELICQGKIHEIVHTENIGKLNSIIKGLSGHNIPLVTIADADVLFLEGWQEEVFSIFQNIQSSGVVGLTSQFGMFKYLCENFLFSNLFNSNLRFEKIVDSESLIRFYDSIGWKRNYNPLYLEYTLKYNKNNKKVIVGSGHFVATYRRELLTDLKTYLPFKLGGISEYYIDKLTLGYSLNRFTTDKNYAYHMGNVFEDWMQTELDAIKIVEIKKNDLPSIRVRFSKYRIYKNIFLNKIFNLKWFYRFFIKWKKIPQEYISTF